MCKRKRKVYSIITMISYDHNGHDTPFEIVEVKHTNSIESAREYLESKFSGYVRTTSSKNEDLNVQTYTSFEQDRFTIHYEPASYMPHYTIRSIKSAIFDSVQI